MQHIKLCVKTTYGTIFVGLTKSMDARFFTLQQAMLDGKLENEEFLMLAYGVEAVCDGALDRLSMDIDAFSLKEGQTNGAIYKCTLRDTRTGRRGPLGICTDLGNTMVSLTQTMDRICLAVTMLMQERRIELEKARTFFRHIQETVNHCRVADQELAHVVQNIQRQ